MKIRAELIDLYIRRTGLSKKDFCKECAISIKTLQKIMRNDYKYQTAPILRVAETMNVEVCDLYTKE